MNLSFTLISCDSDPLLESEVADIEAVIGSLPDDYRNFLLHSNGGRSAHDELFFSVGDEAAERFDITAFTVIDPGFPPPVLTARLAGEQRRLIAVARCEDSPFLMSLDRPDASEIYYWAYELEELWEAEEDDREYLPEDSSVTRVASSFAELLDGLTAEDRRTAPAPGEIEPSVESYAKYGDLCFEEAKSFFDAMPLGQLNETWPKDGKYPHSPIHYAANWGQVRVVEYLIDRGVDRHQALRYCTNSVDITKLLLAAGATQDELRQHLFSACSGLGATRLPEQKELIIELLVGRGVQPDFNDPGVLEEWQQLIRQTSNKKLLRYFMKEINFPVLITDQIQKKLDRPRY